MELKWAVHIKKELCKQFLSFQVSCFKNHFAFISLLNWHHFFWNNTKRSILLSKHYGECSMHILLTLIYKYSNEASNSRNLIRNSWNAQNSKQSYLFVSWILTKSLYNAKSMLGTFWILSSWLKHFTFTFLIRVLLKLWDEGRIILTIETRNHFDKNIF